MAQRIEVDADDKLVFTVTAANDICPIVVNGDLITAYANTGARGSYNIPLTRGEPTYFTAFLINAQDPGAGLAAELTRNGASIQKASWDSGPGQSFGISVVDGPNCVFSFIFQVRDDG
jgi:hypothetical protein